MAVLDDLKRFGPDQAEVLSPSEARRLLRRLTAAHYENFSVVTWLTPRPLRPAFQSIYAFCRWSDDLGDEVGDPARRWNCCSGGVASCARCTQGRRGTR